MMSVREMSSGIMPSESVPGMTQEGKVLRCLKCRLDGVPADAVTCPRCSANLPALLYDVLPPETLLRVTDYRIEYAIGRGGFGITYRAMHNVLDRLVCIKEFFPHE